MLCALSLLLVAFAHKPIITSAAASGYGEVDLAEFVLPDGTLPVLCLSDEEDGQHAGFNHCEACRIFSSVQLQPPFEVFVLNRLNAAAHQTIPRKARGERTFLRPGASPRGPPLSYA